MKKVKAQRLERLSERTQIKPIGLVSLCRLELEPKQSVGQQVYRRQIPNR